jgi:energy-coupling factor transport system substrate-specific component
MERLIGLASLNSSRISPRVALRYMTLIACLSSLGIISRIYMASIPNVKPVTMIIIVSAMVFGVRFGLTLSTLIVIGSNLVLGFGVFAVMQIIAWGAIALLFGLLGKIYKKIPHFLMAVIAGLTGFLFGLIVSLNVMLITGPMGFYTYWLAGIPFDAAHTVSNFIFYILLAPVLIRVLELNKRKFMN